MNCEEAREKIAIRTVLESFNMFPAKENKRTAFYFALDRKEKVPSLSVDFIKNKAFDFGTGNSYDIVSIVQAVKRCSVSDALKYLGNFDLSKQMMSNQVNADFDLNYKIVKVGEVRHFALIQYLESRKVSSQKNLIKEVHYELNGKKYFGVGFLNNSGGLEIRNKYSKICLGKKDITLIENNLNYKNEVVIFEGFFDYLTYRAMNKLDAELANYLVLNSTAMLFKTDDLLKSYNKILLFLDNDQNGMSTKEIIKLKYDNVEDCSFLYASFNDLNEWFVKRR